MSYPKFVTDFSDMIKWMDNLKKDNAAKKRRIDQLETKLDILKENDLVPAGAYYGEDMLKCDYGLYKVYWAGEDGGTSLASIGGTYNGERWLAPTNWTTGCMDNHNPTGLLKEKLDDITKIVLLKEQEL